MPPTVSPGLLPAVAVVVLHLVGRVGGIGRETVVERARYPAAGRGGRGEVPGVGVLVRGAGRRCGGPRGRAGRGVEIVGQPVLGYGGRCRREEAVERLEAAAEVDPVLWSKLTFGRWPLTI